MSQQEVRREWYQNVTTVSRATLLEEFSDSEPTTVDEAHNRFLRDLATNGNVAGVVYFRQERHGRDSRLSVFLKEVGNYQEGVISPPSAVDALIGNIRRIKKNRRLQLPVSYVIVGDHPVEDIVTQQSAGAINGRQPRVILFS